MIKIEPNKLPFALTNDQFSTIAGIIAQDWTLNYDITEGDTNGIVWVYVYTEGSVPSRHWVEADGSVSTVEYCDWLAPTEGA
jgi:hypothetical protein